MKHSTNLILFVLTLLFCSCSNYTTEQEVVFANLNDSIKIATSKGEAWTQNPESISKHLFPTEAHTEGNRNYSVQVDCLSKISCDVTVIDEGPMDDEVSGQRWKATFKKTTDCWQLTKLTKSLKLRR